MAQLPQFRDATTKIAVMLFKRIVFESRRKAKGVLRPKTRLNYKDLATVSLFSVRKSPFYYNYPLFVFLKATMA